MYKQYEFKKNIFFFKLSLLSYYYQKYAFLE